MIKHICTHCGSDQISFDALTKWDPVKQEHVVHEVYDGSTHCDQCDGECHTKEVEYIPVDPIQERVERIANGIIEDVEKSGSARFDTSNHYNWEKFHWNHRHSIMEAMRSKGYKVKPISRHGVLEIHVSKKPKQ